MTERTDDRLAHPPSDQPPSDQASPDQASPDQALTPRPARHLEAAMLAAAVAAQGNAWAPYSRFRVGAAVLAADGTIHAGCNVENATYGATVCAERNAVAAAVVNGARELLAVVVVTDADPPAMPCGVCRQVLAEFADDLPIIAVGAGGRVERTTLDHLLPRRFSGRDLPDP